jgi:alternate signal-mediated exported protein
MMNTKVKRTLSGICAIAVAVALLIGGTYAYRQFEHKSNPFRNDPNYQGRLVEDYEEKEWIPGTEIKKEIFVRNMGETRQFPGTNWGDIYVRVKLKEHMDITPIDYVYYPGTGTAATRFMVDKDGDFVRFPATGTIAAQLTTIRNSSVWANVITDPAKRAAFLAGLTEANFVRLRGYYDTQDYWYVVTKANDPNGQYGAFVVMDKVADPSKMISITGSDRAAGMDYSNGVVLQGPSDHENEECLYPVHYWDAGDPAQCALESHKYAEWELGDSIVMASAWDGNPVNKWILDPVTGWATWGNALKPGEETDLLLKSVTPIRLPDGQLLYVIHADMQATDLTEMLYGDWDGARTRSIPTSLRLL